MNHNPYSPPSAVVADTEPGSPMERPAQVTLAVRVLWLGLILGLPGAIYNIFVQPLPPGFSRGLLLGISAVSWVIGFLIVYWIFGAVGKGKNWARILLAVLLGINALVIAVMGKALLAVMAVNGTWQVVIYLVQLLTYAVAVVLTFMPNARPWFKPR